MTNLEPSFNSTQFQRVFLKFGCDYSRTKIGVLYTSYKQLNQGQLQKALQKNNNDKLKMISIIQSQGCCGFSINNKHLFKDTFWNPETKKFETPPCLLKRNYNDVNQYYSDNKLIYNTWLSISKIHLKEMEDYYQERKRELEIKQKANHIDHANEKINCPCCKAFVARTNLTRHLKTNKKCLAFKITNPEPSSNS